MCDDVRTKGCIVAEFEMTQLDIIDNYARFVYTSLYSYIYVEYWILEKIFPVSLEISPVKMWSNSATCQAP